MKMFETFIDLIALRFDGIAVDEKALSEIIDIGFFNTYNVFNFIFIF